MSGITNIHCAMCEGPEVFTIYRGDSLCHHCYNQMSKAQGTIDDINSERDAAIREIKNKLTELYDLIISDRYRS